MYNTAVVRLPCFIMGELVGEWVVGGLVLWWGGCELVGGLWVGR